MFNELFILIILMMRSSYGTNDPELLNNDDTAVREGEVAADGEIISLIRSVNLSNTNLISYFHRLLDVCERHGDTIKLLDTKLTENQNKLQKLEDEFDTLRERMKEITPENYKILEAKYIEVSKTVLTLKEEIAELKEKNSKEGKSNLQLSHVVEISSQDSQIGEKSIR